MSEATCPVKQTIDALEAVIRTGGLKNPRSRRIAEEILQLLNDVAWGRAGRDHLPTIGSRADELVASAPDEATRDSGARVKKALADHMEVFASHVKTHTCAAGDCVRLARAPRGSGHAGGL